MICYTPTRVGYECAAMVRYRPESADSKRIEIYPLSQWGDYYYDGPENERAVSSRTALLARNKLTRYRCAAPECRTQAPVKCKSLCRPTA